MTGIRYSDAELERFMAEALWEARRGLRFGEVPVGAVVVRGPAVVGRGHNLRETLKDPTAHAEILALRDASGRTGTWYLDDCVLLSTLEPCCMCAGALVNARIAGVVYGARDPKAGACESLYEIPGDPRLNHRLWFRSGVLESECSALLSRFFRELRSGGGT